MTAHEVLRSTRSVLLVDFPGIEVPEALARAGFEVVLRGGPGPDDYSRVEVDGPERREVRTGQAPDRADLVYVYRPLEELQGILSLARDLQARTVWLLNGSDAARAAVEAAGLTYVDEPSIVDAARALRESG
jgi:predicted CoA-binding protein